jgi:hypothetical protein
MLPRQISFRHAEFSPCLFSHIAQYTAHASRTIRWRVKGKTKMSNYIVMTSSAKVSGKAAKFGRYRNVAVVETDGITGARWPRPRRWWRN